MSDKIERIIYSISEESFLNPLNQFLDMGVIYSCIKINHFLSDLKHFNVALLELRHIFKISYTCLKPSNKVYILGGPNVVSTVKNKQTNLIWLTGSVFLQ